MPLPRRNDPEPMGTTPGTDGPARRRGPTGARILWWWLWIIVAGLVIWWAVWGWGGYGGWWGGKRAYHTGTNGGRVSEPMGQPSQEPDETDNGAPSALGKTANPNTGAHGRPAAGEATAPSAPPQK